MTQQLEAATDGDGPSVHTRTYAWSEPTAWAAELGRVDGLTLLRRMVSGELPPPPVASMVGFAAAEVDEGRFALVVEPQVWHENPLGTVHGGVLATLLDTAASCAVHSTLPAGVGYTTTDLHTRFIASVRPGTGAVRCEGRVLHRGRTTAMAESRLEDASGRLLAHATVSCLLFEARRPAA